MSTKSTILDSDDFHLYSDLMDAYPGPHAYLRIDNGLVKDLCVVSTRRGLSVTVRLPPEVFAILRPDIAESLRQSDWPFGGDERDRRSSSRRKSTRAKSHVSRRSSQSDLPRR
jgi:hypothetical protein